MILLLQWEWAVWLRNTSLESISFITGREPVFLSLSFIERKHKKPWAITENHVCSEGTRTSAIELKDWYFFTLDHWESKVEKPLSLGQFIRPWLRAVFPGTRWWTAQSRSCQSSWYLKMVFQPLVFPMPVDTRISEHWPFHCPGQNTLVTPHGGWAVCSLQELAPLNI